MIIERTNYRSRSNQHMTGACQVSVYFFIYVTACVVPLLLFKQAGTSQSMHEPVALG